MILLVSPQSSERAGGVGRRGGGGGGEVRRRVAEGERRCERRGERQERETAEGEDVLRGGVRSDSEDTAA